MPPLQMYPNDENYPVQSFDYPVPPPSSEPDEGDVVVVGINREWLPYVLGALDQLMLYSTWEGTADEIKLAVDRAANLKAQIANSTYLEQTEPPYWEDANDVADDDDDGIPWYDELGDWFLTGFLAVTVTPTAGIFYKTYVPKARVALRRGDWGALFKVLINGLQYATGDSYSAVTDILEIDLDIAGFAAANGLGPAPWDLQIKHNGTGASSAAVPRLEIVRKRLDESEVTAITAIQQVAGQLQVQHGNIPTWVNVTNADNVRRDGSTVITGHQQFRSGSATTALANFNPNAGEPSIIIQLPVTSVSDVIRLNNSSGQAIFSVNSIGRFALRGSDNNMFGVVNGAGNAAFLIGTTAGNPMLTLTGQTGQTANILSVFSSTSVLLAAVTASGSIIGHGSLLMQGATSTAERTMTSMVSTWDVSTDASRRAKIVFNINTWLGSVIPLQMSANGAGVPTIGFLGNQPVPAPSFTAPIVDFAAATLALARALDDNGLIEGTLYPINGSVPTVTGETWNIPALESLIEGIAQLGFIVDATTSGDLIPLLTIYDCVGGDCSYVTLNSYATPILELGSTYTVRLSGNGTTGANLLNAYGYKVAGVWYRYYDAGPYAVTLLMNGDPVPLDEGRDDGIYEIEVEGTGAPFVFVFTDGGAGDNTGSCSIEVCRL